MLRVQMTINVHAGGCTQENTENIMSTGDTIANPPCTEIDNRAQRPMIQVNIVNKVMVLC
jgi:hypothetical protein